MSFAEVAWYRPLVFTADDYAPDREAKRQADLHRRRQLPGERAVALLFAGLFQDAGWYLQGGGQLPDGLPPYAHSPQYLSLLVRLLETLQIKRARDEAEAAQRAAQARQQ